MKFSLVTPSFNQPEWLRLCVASIADQQGVEFEHIVQDASGPAALEAVGRWAGQFPHLKVVAEKDAGMYDAVNRGFRRARGELCAYLNCDEQYLPGALQRVSDFFDRHPEVDVVFGHCVVVQGNGAYLCDRKALTPQLLHTWVSSSLSFLTASLFLRRRVLDQHQLFFDPRLRDLGDAEWAVRLIRSKATLAVLDAFTSIFTETGQNMNLGANAAREKNEFLAAAPAWARACRPLVLAHYRLRRLCSGAYRCRPYEYAIYTLDSPEQRRTFQVTHPTYRWIRPQAQAPGS
jgi:glycosyltransferase involved in cell wall biosynthesis